MKKYTIILSIIFCSSLQSEPFNLANVITILYNLSPKNNLQVNNYRDDVIKNISRLEVQDPIKVDATGQATVSVYTNCKLYWPSTLTLLCIPATFLFTRWYYTSKIL